MQDFDIYTIKGVPNTGKYNINYAVYKLALNLYLSYMKTDEDIYDRFIWDRSNGSNGTDSGTVNVVYNKLNEDEEDIFAIENINEIQIEKLIQTEVDVSRFRDLFGPDMNVSEMYYKVFKETAKPKWITSELTEPRTGVCIFPSAKDNMYVLKIPDLVLFMAEKMIHDKCNILWTHYYSITNDMFNEYMRGQK